MFLLVFNLMKIANQRGVGSCNESWVLSLDHDRIISTVEKEITNTNAVQVFMNR